MLAPNELVPSLSHLLLVEEEGSSECGVHLTGATALPFVPIIQLDTRYTNISMRLLDAREPSNDLVHYRDGLKYAVLSHQWGADEVSYRDKMDKRLIGKKIQTFCREVSKLGCQYAWVDTCCIDKTSRSEWNEVTASMYSWFQRAELCCVYLNSVTTMVDFMGTTWFKRTWTLLELLAPEPDKMLFFNKDWKCLGSKSGLAARIFAITGIPIALLRHERNPLTATIGEKLSWAADRGASNKEEIIYALISLLNVKMDMRPGEGLAMATMRMQEEILSNLEDYTVLMCEKPLGLAQPNFHSTSTSDDNPERVMEKPSWGQLELHSPLDLMSKASLSRHLPALDKPPESPQLTGRGLRVTLFAKSISSYMIAWTYCTQERNNKLYAVCIRVVSVGAAKDTRQRYLKGATSGYVCYVLVDRLKSFQLKDVYFAVNTPD